MDASQASGIMNQNITFYYGDRQRAGECRALEQSFHGLGFSISIAKNIEGSRWRQSLRRGLLRTLIYTEWSDRGSVTARTKLSRRTAWRQRASCLAARLLPGDREALARRIDGLIPVYRVAYDYIRSVRPALLLVVTDIYRGQEVELLKAARRYGVPSLGVVGSWDTLTSKGSYLVKPDHLAVWGPAQADQAVRLHGFAKEQVHVVGSLRLDSMPDLDLPHFLLREDRPVVMVAGTSISYWKHEEETVLELAEAGSRIGYDVWYRPHPRRLGRLDGDLSVQRSKWWAHGVYFDQGNGVEGEPERPGRLAGILNRVRVVVTTFSTLAVEAALQGTPSILMGFGASTGGAEPGHGLMMEHAGYEHMQEILKWPNISLAEGSLAVREVIAEYIRIKPTRLESESLRNNALEIVAADGRASERMLDLIRLLAGGHV